MKYKILFFFLLISNSIFSQNEKLDKTKTENIQKVIKLFQTKNIDGITNIVNYPLRREYPILMSKTRLISRRDLIRFLMRKSLIKFQIPKLSNGQKLAGEE
jgi:hypothetical protein